ncbi:MAG: ABC transporter ATP-binding protein [Anaerolineae bacterium]|jgi:ATP-binding cassette subfamily B multidrug efflux pump
MTHGRGLPDAAPAKDASQTLKRVWGYFGEYKWRLTLFAVLLVIGVLAEVLGPYLLGVAVDQFIDPSGAARPAWLGVLLPPDASRARGLATTMLVVAGVYAVTWGMSVAQFRLVVRISQAVLVRLRTEVFEQIQRLSLSFFDKHEAGDLMSRLVNDSEVINDMFGPGLVRLLRSGLGLIGIVVTMVSLNWRLALASFAVLPLVLLVTWQFGTRARKAFRQTRKTIGDVSAELQENIAGVREVQAFSRENATLEEFRAINERNRSANVLAETLASIFTPLLDVLSAIATALVVGYGGYLVLRTSPPLASIGVIVAATAYVDRFYGPIREMAGLFAQFQAAVAGAERIFDLLETPPEVVQRDDAEPLAEVQGRVLYDRVSFRYEADEPVLDGVTFEVEPGQMIALVGPTGAGKTTIANLLPRMYDVQGGQVLLDGRDVRDLRLRDLRQQIGIVPQDTFLFSGTVIDNIRYGRLDATDDEVIAAAKVANAHAFIERLPEGYDTQVGERGSMLSHGNRQLLAIARAVLKDPRVLILDEATSSVDTRTERLIQAALADLLKGRTSLVIAHRLSTIRSADQILVIQQGHIVERGRHEELMAARGVYHELYMSQFRRETVGAEAEPSAL